MPPMGNHSGTPGMNPPAGDHPDCPAGTTCGGPGPMTGGNHPQGDPCMVVPAGPDRVACYAAPRP
jgi:hypothetical protein